PRRGRLLSRLLQGKLPHGAVDEYGPASRADRRKRQLDACRALQGLPRGGAGTRLAGRDAHLPRRLSRFRLAEYAIARPRVRSHARGHRAAHRHRPCRARGGTRARAAISRALSSGLSGEGNASALVLKFAKSGKHLSLRGARRATKQSRESFALSALDCFAALAMTAISGWDELPNRDTRPHLDSRP